MKNGWKGFFIITAISLMILAATIGMCYESDILSYEEEIVDVPAETHVERIQRTPMQVATLLLFVSMTALGVAMLLGGIAYALIEM